MSAVPLRIQRTRKRGFNLQAASPNGLPVVYVPFDKDTALMNLRAAIRAYTHGLAPEEQRTLVLTAMDQLGISAFPRAGKVLKAVTARLAKSQVVSAIDLKLACPDATPRQVFNAISYLVRKRKIARLGYGQYSLIANAPLSPPTHGGTER